jgi:hypothetical protein
MIFRTNRETKKRYCKSYETPLHRRTGRSRYLKGQGWHLHAAGQPFSKSWQITSNNQKQPICLLQLHATFISRSDVMFICSEGASETIQLFQLPRSFNWRRLNPNRNGALPCRDAGVGLQLRGHTCGLDDCSSGLNWALTFMWRFSLQIQQRQTNDVPTNRLTRQIRGVRSCA